MTDKIGNIYKLEEAYFGNKYAIIVGKGKFLWSRWTYPSCGMFVTERNWELGMLLPKTVTGLSDDCYVRIQARPWLVDPPDSQIVGKITDKKYLAFLKVPLVWIEMPRFKLSSNLLRWKENDRKRRCV